MTDRKTFRSDCNTTPSDSESTHVEVRTIRADTPRASSDSDYGVRDSFHEEFAGRFDRFDRFGRGRRIGDDDAERVACDRWAAVKGMTREELLARLNERINGQDNAKQALIKAIKVSACRASRHREGNASDLRPMPVLLVGPTGCGKSEIVSALADAIGAKFVHIDGSRLTGEGWSGQSMSSLLLQVAQAQQDCPDKPVIFFLDEFDKVVKIDEIQPSFDPQSSLFTLLDGADTMLVDKQNMSYRIDFDGIQIIFGGAFQDIGPIIAKRLGDGRDADWGFGQDREGCDEDMLLDECDIEPNDLIEYGVMPELVGRMGTIVTMHGLSSEVIRGLVKGTPASAEARFSRVLTDAYTFDISDAAADYITSLVVERRLGARGIDQVLADAYGEVVVITSEDPTVTGATVELCDGELVVRFERDARVA